MRPAPDPCAACPHTGPAPWEALVTSLRGRLIAVARAEGQHGEDAFDVVQEAFTTWIARYADRPPEQAPRTLVALTRNLARNRRRLHAHARPHDGDTEQIAAATNPDDALVRAEEARHLAHCVARLADVQRAVVTLRMLDELPGADVAAQLGLSPGHVAVLLHRARADLTSCLAMPFPRRAR